MIRIDINIRYQTSHQYNGTQVINNTQRKGQYWRLALIILEIFQNFWSVNESEHGSKLTT
jgi:hypothetical protein